MIECDAANGEDRFHDIDGTVTIFDCNHRGAGRTGTPDYSMNYLLETLGGDE
jgi:hypothetical protein